MIDKIKSDLGKVASKAAANAEKYRQRALDSLEKADAAKSVLNEARTQEARASNEVATVTAEYKRVITQVLNFEQQIEKSFEKEKSIKNEIVTTEKKIQSAISAYEKIRLDISSYINTYNEAKREADSAAVLAAVGNIGQWAQA